MYYSLQDYQIDGEVYRQAEGGSIGMDLTGVVSDIYMIEWDKELIKKIHESSIMVKLYKRYKDDINMVLDVDGMQIEYGDDREREEETMKYVKTLAYEVDPALGVTVDYDHKYDDGRLPVLDLKVWLGKT